MGSAVVMKLDTDRRKKLNEFLLGLHIDFNDIDLLNMSLSHSSYANEFDQKYANNERLEFLGDSVLNLIITDYLYRFYPEKSEGELSKARSYIVSEESLSSIARELNLGNYILLGRGKRIMMDVIRKVFLQMLLRLLLVHFILMVVF